MNSSRALTDLEEVKAIGGSKSVTRTAEQSEIARYCYENSPRGWNRIAREVSGTRQFDVWENARLFALVNLAMADGFIGGFESKYHCNYWRPAPSLQLNGTWSMQTFAQVERQPQKPVSAKLARLARQYLG